MELPAGINSTRLVDARLPFISIDPAVAKNTGRNDPCPCAHNREPEPLCCRVFLWARLDSNQDLTDYESAKSRTVWLTRAKYGGSSSESIRFESTVRELARNSVARRLRRDRLRGEAAFVPLCMQTQE